MKNQKIFWIKSESKFLKKIRNEANRFLKTRHIPPRERDVFLLTIGEACTNSIKHAYRTEPGHKIRVHILDGREKITIRVRDYGAKIDLSKLKVPKLPPEKPHGLGVYFLKTLMDEVEYRTAHRQGNELVLVKYKK